MSIIIGRTYERNYATGVAYIGCDLFHASVLFRKNNSLSKPSIWVFKYVSLGFTRLSSIALQLATFIHRCHPFPSRYDRFAFRWNAHSLLRSSLLRPFDFNSIQACFTLFVIGRSKRTGSIARNNDSPTNLRTVTIEIYWKRRPERSEPFNDFRVCALARTLHRYHSRRSFQLFPKAVRSNKESREYGKYQIYV